jgi:hypothetical protein
MLAFPSHSNNTWRPPAIYKCGCMSLSSDHFCLSGCIAEVSSANHGVFLMFLPHPPAAKTFIPVFNLLLCSSHSNFVLLPQALSCDHDVPFAIHHSRWLNAKEEETSLPTKSTRTSRISKRRPPEVSLSCLFNEKSWCQWPPGFRMYRKVCGSGTLTAQRNTQLLG